MGGGGGESDNWLTSPVAFRSLQTHQDEPVLRPDHGGCEECLGPACCRGSVVTGFKCSLSAPSNIHPPPHVYCHFRLDLTGPAGLGGKSAPSSSTAPPSNHLSELPACKWLLQWPICLWIPIQQAVRAWTDWLEKRSFCTVRWWWWRVEVG